MSSTVIAIDGPAASGKTTAAKNLAEKLHIPYINTGSLYRAIAWKAYQNQIPFSDETALKNMLLNTKIQYREKNPDENPEIEIDGVFPGEELRKPHIAKGASDVAALSAVRGYALQIQRETAKTQLVVLEGRDIGTVIFPDAKYKFFFHASAEVRAKRRLAQIGEIADGATLESVIKEIEERDFQDTMRSIAPLKAAPDAILINTDHLNQDEVTELLLQHIAQN